MANLTATTPIGTFFAAVITRIQSQLTVAAHRVFVVDKLRLQDAAVPNFQIEPVSMIPLAENTGANTCIVEYKVHSVVKVEYDAGGRMTEKLVDNKSAFLQMNTVAAALLGMAETTSYTRQMFLRMDSGAHDEAQGLTTATGHFRCHVRTLSDG